MHGTMSLKVSSQVTPMDITHFISTYVHSHTPVILPSTRSNVAAFQQISPLKFETYFLPVAP